MKTTQLILSLAGVFSLSLTDAKIGKNISLLITFI